MRWSSCLLLLVLTTFGSSRFAAAQAPAKPDESAGVSKTLTTKDGWSIEISYFESNQEKEAPVVVLLPGKDESRVVWNPLATALKNLGFAAITVDLRKSKNGKSKPPAKGSPQSKSDTVTKLDYEAMIGQDLEAVKKFVYDEHQAKRLNMRRLAIVGADASTVIALNYAAFDWSKVPFDDAPVLANKTPRGQDVRAIVLLSPAEAVTGVSVNQSLQFIRQTDISVMMLHPNKTADKAIAEKMFQQLGGDKQKSDDDPRIERFGLETAQKGTQLLQQPVQIGNVTGKTSQLVIGFLTKRVKKPEVEWRDRKSRLE